MGLICVRKSSNNAIKKKLISVILSFISNKHNYKYNLAVLFLHSKISFIALRQG